MSDESLRRVKGMQCKHIDDASMIRAVDSLSGRDRRWTFTDAVAELYPDVPFKVVAAKLSRLMRRGYLEGCDCGCRGDWYLTAKGSELIS